MIVSGGTGMAPVRCLPRSPVDEVQVPYDDALVSVERLRPARRDGCDVSHAPRDSITCNSWIQALPRSGAIGVRAVE